MAGRKEICQRTPIYRTFRLDFCCCLTLFFCLFRDGGGFLGMVKNYKYAESRLRKCNFYSRKGGGISICFMKTFLKNTVLPLIYRGRKLFMWLLWMRQISFGGWRKCTNWLDHFVLLTISNYFRNSAQYYTA